MAPQNTMAVSQQQQQQTTGRNLGEQATKSKKRKGKASNSNQSAPQQQQPSKVAIADNQQVEVKQQQPLSISNPPLSKTLVKQASFEAANRQQQIEKTSLKQQQQPNQVPADKEIVGLKKKPIPIAAATVLAKQISTEESDDIDAGIELDGSSNSGSSVKDPNEDQIKSASVSPIMAQSNLINETREPQKHAIEDAPCEQLAGSLCTDIAPNKKVGSTTKQQLAANQQVIDADEQLLQQKLQSKQSRKSSTQSNISLSSVGRLNSSTTTNTSMQQSGGATPQSPALCKVCDQHVYQMERLMAEKAVYHNSCFRCYQCKIQLRINNYSSHDGKVYCKAHHKQLFQPQVKLDSEDDVDIVAKSSKYERAVTRTWTFSQDEFDCMASVTRSFRFSLCNLHSRSVSTLNIEDARREQWVSS